MACVWYCSNYAIGWKVVMHTTGINEIFVDKEVGVRVLLLKIRYWGFCSLLWDFRRLP